MSTSTRNSKQETIESRKAKHLDICLDPALSVETGSNQLSEVRFVHRALPEIDASRIDTGVSFLDHPVALPFFISSMTGGSEAAYGANKQLAEAAQELGIPVGMGSIRILFRKPDVFEHFYLRKFAPDVPIMANIGAVQLRDMDPEDLNETIRRLEVDALVVHLNAGQELFQPEGDRNFTGMVDGIARFVELSPVPVVVKETGFGINPAEVEQLLDGGVRYVNVAGAGGTNWIKVEAFRLNAESEIAQASEFDDWGLSTSLVLAALDRKPDRVLASGGVRTGIDVAKLLALGAHSVGLALPFIRAVQSGGVEEVVGLARRVERTLRSVMAMTGSRSIEDLRRAPVLISERLRTQARQLRITLGMRDPLGEGRTDG